MFSPPFGGANPYVDVNKVIPISDKGVDVKYIFYTRYAGATDHLRWSPDLIAHS